MPEFSNSFSGVKPGRKLSDPELARALRLDMAAEEETDHVYVPHPHGYNRQQLGQKGCAIYRQ